MDDARAGVLCDVGVDEDPEGALAGLLAGVLGEVGEDGLVLLVLERGALELGHDLVVGLLLEDVRETGLHHDVGLLIRQVLN